MVPVPSSFNVIDVSEATHRITQYVYFGDESGFTPFSQILYPRPGRRFEHDVLRAANIADGNGGNPEQNTKSGQSANPERSAGPASA